MAGALEVIQVTVEMLYLGQQILNVYHALSSDSVPDGDVVQDLVTQLDLAYQELQDFLDGSLAPGPIRLVNVSDEEELDIVTFGDFNGGTVGGALGLPPGVAAVVTFPTQALGVRGRKFIAGASENQNSDGVWEGTFITALEAYAALIATPFIGSESGSPWSFCAYSPGGTPRPFTGYVVTNVPGYQRRRKQGVGS